MLAAREEQVYAEYAEGAYSTFEDRLEEELAIIELKAMIRRVGSLETRFTTMEGRIGE